MSISALYNYLTGAHDAHRSGREVATETKMGKTNKQTEAAERWVAEMIDRETNADHAGKWTKFEVGETHEAGCQAVRSEERARLNELFEAAGREEGIASYLNA